jgi:hypothetical protein
MSLKGYYFNQGVRRDSTNETAFEGMLLYPEFLHHPVY